MLSRSAFRSKYTGAIFYSTFDRRDLAMQFVAAIDRILNDTGIDDIESFEPLKQSVLDGDDPTDACLNYLVELLSMVGERYGLKFGAHFGFWDDGIIAAGSVSMIARAIVEEDRK